MATSKLLVGKVNRNPLGSAFGEGRYYMNDPHSPRSLSFVRTLPRTAHRRSVRDVMKYTETIANILAFLVEGIPFVAKTFNRLEIDISARFSYLRQ